MPNDSDPRRARRWEDAREEHRADPREDPWEDSRGDPREEIRDEPAAGRPTSTFQETDRYGPALDDELSREIEGMIRGTGSTHAEEWKDPEPAGEVPFRGVEPGSPPGMTQEDVDARSEVAKALAPVRFPASTDEILRRFDQAGVPRAVSDAAEALPPDATYDGVSDVVHALGIPTEDHRT